MIVPEDYCSSDFNGGHKDLRAAIVSGCNAPPVLEFCKHVFDFMTDAVLGFVEVYRFDPVALWWDAGFYPGGVKGCSEPVGVVAPVRDHEGR